MRLLLHSISATLVAVLFSPFSTAPAAAADASCAPSVPAAAVHAAFAAQPPAALAGQRAAVEVDLAASAEFELAADGGLRYGMAFNDVTEGWSWQPQARPEDEDYYRWKFLPLGSVSEAGASYVQEEKIGEPQLTRIERRHDYFLAFDNVYEFFPRGEGGFAATLPPGRAVRLVALARLGDPGVAASTTFWKAVYGRPVDFTLRKHYLVGRLEQLLVCDAASGILLARIAPQVQR